MPKPQGDVCCAECPSRGVLELLAEKWALLVIFRLRIKSHRTAELRREIGGVSEKMLIQTLRKLERHGLVERHDFGELPPRVEYSLSKLGCSLSLPVEQLQRWVAKNMVDVLRATAKFDAQASTGKKTAARKTVVIKRAA